MLRNTRHKTKHAVFRNCLTLLLGHTDSSATATGCLCVLTAYTQSPEVSQTTMRTNLLHSLQIFTELRVDTVCEDLGIFAIHDISLSVKEPCWNLVLCGVLDDCDDALEFFGCKFTGTFVEINIGLLAHQIGVSSSNALDFGQGVHDLLLSIDVGVEKSENELKVRLLS